MRANVVLRDGRKCPMHARVLSAVRRHRSQAHKRRRRRDYQRKQPAILRRPGSTRNLQRRRTLLRPGRIMQQQDVLRELETRLLLSPALSPYLDDHLVVQATRSLIKRTPSPAINSQIIQIDRGRAAGAKPVDLEVGEKHRSPTQGKGRPNRGIQILLHSIQPD